MLSVLIEGGIILFFKEEAQLKRPLTSIGLANVASYAALLILLWVYADHSIDQAGRRGTAGPLPTPGDRQRNVPQGRHAGDGKTPHHHFEMLPAENIKAVSEAVFRVGSIRLSGTAIKNETQVLPVELTWPDESWTQWQLTALDINFDGFMDLGVREYGGSKWGRLHWWHYHPGKKRFYRNGLTRQLSKLKHNHFWTVPESRQIKITRFYGVSIKEHTFEFVDGQLREVDSTFVHDHGNGNLRGIGPHPSDRGLLPKGCDSFPVLASQQAASVQDPP